MEKKGYRKSIKVNHYVGGASTQFQNPMRWSPQSKFHLTGFCTCVPEVLEQTSDVLRLCLPTHWTH